MRILQLLLALLALLAVGCGGRATSNPDSSRAIGQTDAAADETGGGEAPPSLVRTTPVAVPQPAIAREQLAPPTQEIWLEVERAVALRPPEPPAATEEDVLNRWYQTEFTVWLGQRVESAQRAEGHAGGLEGAPPWDRGVAAGVLGYLHEQTAAEARGAPIPPSVAADAELLGVYARALDGALMPLVRRSLEGYRFCVAAFDELAGASEEPAWREWREFCEDRGEELVRVYAHAGEGP
ncbi:MAG: hypothetical protein ACK6CU_27140 [Deltaproteobacteria bacterium]|jgi:hypothetical protein